MSKLPPLCYTREVTFRGTRRSAFTLVEILVALAMIGLAFYMLMGSLQSFRTNRGVVRGDAEILAELLRSLRQQAMTQHRPVGLGIPSEDHTCGAAGGYYVLEGEVHPKIVRVVELKEGQAGQITAGFWAGPAFTGSPSSSFTASQYTLANWQPSRPNDSLVMFLPSGEVLTNLPTFQGQVALVLARSLRASWTSLSGQPCVEIAQAQLPMTIWCSILGEIRIETGLPGSAGLVSSAPVAPATALAPLPALSSDPNASPQFVSPNTAGPLLEISPPPNGNTLTHVASGHTGTLAIDRYLSLKVAATDPNGDQLWCSWSCTTSTSRPNAFTKAGEVPMIYNPRMQHWESTFAWHVMEPAPGEEFRLDATISDHRGGSKLLSSQLTTGGQFRILTAGRLAFVRGNDTWISNWDGTDPVIVKKNRVNPRWSEDASLLLVREPGTGKLYKLSPDGRFEELIADFSSYGSYISAGEWRPDSSEVGFAAIDGTGNTMVRTADVWGGSIEDEWNGGAALPLPAGSQPVVDFGNSDNVVLSGDTVGPMYVLTKAGNVALTDAGGTPVLGAQAAWNGTTLSFKNATGGIEIWSMTGTEGGLDWKTNAQLHLSSALSNATGPRLNFNSPGYAVVEADDGANRNCFLLWGGGALGSPLKVFNFDARQPDWSAQ